MEDTIKKAGNYFDLDQCEKAYELVGEKTTWLDYSNGDGWDEEKYYKDFEEWWRSLPFEEQTKIYNKIVKN